MPDSSTPPFRPETRDPRPETRDLRPEPSALSPETTGLAAWSVTMNPLLFVRLAVPGSVPVPVKEHDQ